MKKREVTSKRVAAIAGRVLEDLKYRHAYNGQLYINTDGYLGGSSYTELAITVADMKALAASCLPQKGKQ